MKDEELKEVQKEALKIMKVIHKICEEEKIEYFILGGTFIGAVRHKGFIPWDDDIDIAMDRENYNKFLEIAEKKLPKYLELEHYSKSDSIGIHWIKIVNKNCQIVEKKDNISSKQFLFIDIFPFDKVPDNIVKRSVFKIRLYMNGLKLRLSKAIFLSKENNQAFSRKSKQIITKLFSCRLFRNCLENQKVNKEYDKLTQKYENTNTKLIANLCVNYKFSKIYRELFEKEKLGKIVKYQFEDTELNGIENYDYLLGQTFGDYMKLPPEEERKNHIVKLIKNRRLKK